MNWKPYAQFVRSLPCSNCGDDTGCDQHHEVGNKCRGVGLKSHDIRSCPLCRTCHTALHYVGPDEYERRYGFSQCAAILDTIEQAVLRGVLVLDKGKVQ